MSDESNANNCANNALTSDCTLESPVTSAHLGVICSPFFASVTDLSTFTADACSFPLSSDYGWQKQSQSHNAETSDIAQDLARIDPFKLIPLIICEAER